MVSEMKTLTRYLTVICSAAAMGATGIWGPPPASSDPTPGSQPADRIIQELHSAGYAVSINWVAGTNTLPLDRCQVSAIHNPNRGIPALPKTSVTVYVDVRCPDSGSNS